MNKTLIPLVIFALLAVLFWSALSQIEEGKYDPRDIPTEFIGKSMPDFSLPDLYDETKMVKAADYKGKVWLLNVWGTWCAECWKEHEYLLHLSQQGVPIVGINWRDDADEAKAFLDKKGNPFSAVGFDPNSDAVIDLGVYGAPETFLIDADGIIQVKHKGAIAPAIWQKKFLKYFSQDNKS